MSITKNELVAIRYRVFEIYKSVGIHSLPIELEKIAIMYGIYITTFETAQKFELKLNGENGYTIMRKNGSARVFLIVINENDNPYDRRFTVAHEIGHILLGHFDRYCEKAEDEANAFALELLAPLPIVNEYLVPTDISDMCKISVNLSKQIMTREDKFPVRLFKLYRKQFNVEFSLELCA